jgi:hypothetical protein
MLDMEEAMVETDAPTLSWHDLFRLLGVQTTGNGVPVNMTNAINACVHVATNPAVEKLPHTERIRALRAAAAAHAVLMER